MSLTLLSTAADSRHTEIADQIDVSSDTSLSDTDADDPLIYQDIFISSGNSLKILLSMAIGVKDERGQLIVDLDEDPTWKKPRVGQKSSLTLFP